jgi:broad specificity phosphatase PhoE
VPALHEHLRHSAPYGTPQEFEASIQALFTLPDRLVFGEETAHQAQARFTRAVQDIADAHPNQIVIIVAHGTVISLHLSAALHWTPLQTFTFWKRLELSGGVVVEGRIIIEEISL